MEDKARTNLQAAELLKGHGFFDSCASRAYYAAYLAGWAWMLNANQTPPVDQRGSKYWPHASFAQELFNWGALSDPELLDDFEFLRGRRVQADYYPDPVIEEEAEEAFEMASKLVNQLVGT
jgi:uncharacterized protein (UPF0332 family)